MTWLVLLNLANIAVTDTRQLWGLMGIMTDGVAWPAPGGWALSAEAIAMLDREVHQRQLRVIVELGPGVSSLILGRSLLEAELYGLEHDKRFANRLRSQLVANGITAYTLIDAPLVAQPFGNRTIDWYDPASIAALPSHVDVLLVDGPPNWEGKGARSPALAKLRDRLSVGGLILVDDAHRADERRMVNEWLKTGAVAVIEDRHSFVLLEVV
jgi:predicted O-methyltransferase YrrM